MLSINLVTPKDLQLLIAQRFRDFRVFQNLKRQTLAEMSGVPEPSIKRFELKGEISLRSLLSLAHALGALDQFNELFELPKAASLAEIEERERQKKDKNKKSRGRQ